MGAEANNYCNQQSRSQWLLSHSQWLLSRSQWHVKQRPHLVEVNQFRLECCILRLGAKPQISAGRMCERFSESIEMCLCRNSAFMPCDLANICFILIVIKRLDAGFFGCCSSTV